MAASTVPDRDQKCFERARELEAAGKFDSAIEMYLEGLSYVPDIAPVHQELRAVSLRRKANGGKPLGLFTQFRLRMLRRSAVQRMLSMEKLWCFDPGNVDHMIAFANAATAVPAIATTQWVRAMIQQETR